MFIIKKFFSFFIFSSFFFLLFYFLNFNNYVGNKILFFIYNLLSFGLFLVVLKKNNSAFEFFTYIFFLLSFWFKFNCILFFESVKVLESDFDLNISNYDNATFVIIIVFAACITASLIKEFILNKFIKKHKFFISNSFIIFYKKNRIYIFFLFSVFLISIWCTNFYYKIYSKGLVNDHISPFIKYFYSWSLTYGLAVLTSLIIFLDLFIFKKKKIFIIGIFESFLTQMNIYSRSFLFFFISYLRGFLLLPSIKKFKFSKLFLLKFLIIILIIFFLSIFSSNKLRDSQFYESGTAGISTTLSSTLSHILFLSVNRWVGIDSLLAVSQSTNLSFNFFLSAFYEQKNIKSKSFYIDNFFSRFDYTSHEKKNLNIVITPGIVAFLYYSGSILFVFFSIIILILICSGIEMLFFYFSFGNTILANIIGYSLSVRFVHFGYVPFNTVNFLLSFLVTFFIIYFFSKIIEKKPFKI